MSLELLVPDIGDFDQVEIIEVLVKKGDNLKKNDPVVTLESDKSSVEVPSNLEGTIEDIKVKIGDKVSKGDLILTISNNSLKDKIPPVTEKIIEEAENIIKSEKKESIAEEEKEEKVPETKIKEKIEFVSSKNDIDPLETKEWLDSLSAVVEQEGPERAHFLIKQLIDQAYRQGSRIPLYTKYSLHKYYSSRGRNKITR